MKPSSLVKIVGVTAFALGVTTLPFSLPTAAQDATTTTPGGTGTDTTTTAPGTTGTTTYGSPGTTTDTTPRTTGTTTTDPVGTTTGTGTTTTTTDTADRNGFDWGWLGLLGLIGLAGLVPKSDDRATYSSDADTTTRTTTRY